MTVLLANMKLSVTTRTNLRGLLTRRKKSTNLKKTAISNEEYCMRLVKQKDWEGYLATLILPKTYRKSVFALRAFNTEISLVGENVSETAIGYMRLRFWKDSLSYIYEGRPPDTPVALELHKAVTSHKLSKLWLSRIIQARENNLALTVFNNISEVEDYAENTSTAQLCLILQCLGINDLHADHMASHIGKAQGIVTMIRATPYHASRRKIYLPLDFMIKHTISQEEIIRGNREQKMKDLIYDLASQANTHLQHARSITPKITRRAKKAFLITTSLDWYLKQLQVVDFDIFHPTLQQRNHMLPISILVRNIRGKV